MVELPMMDSPRAGRHAESGGLTATRTAVVLRRAAHKERGWTTKVACGYR
jgi:hypothetical protein